MTRKEAEKLAEKKYLSQKFPNNELGTTALTALIAKREGYVEALMDCFDVTGGDNFGPFRTGAEWAINEIKNMNKMKVIRIDTPKGQYDLPLKFVAEDRANEYESVGSREWQEEVEWVVQDNFEGVDWLLNNMNWVDVKDHAVKVNDDANVTDEDFWTSSDYFEIIEVEKP